MDENKNVTTDTVTKEKKKRSRDSESTASIVFDDSEEGKCGYGSWEPGFLQCCNSAKGFLVVYCFLVVVQGMLVNGFVNVSISTLEKRFGFNSSETGVMATGYDIGFCCLTMFVTYFGARSHRPRMVGIGAFVMGIGAMVFWLPHFTTGNYVYASEFEDVCTNQTSADCDDVTSDSGLRYYIWVFIFAQILHGFGCVPLYTLGLSYMEDSVSKESAPLYLGIGNAASTFGPVLGYGLGGVVLAIYVDFDSVDPSDVNITSSDPRWVGAWWLGIMASMVCAFIICVPLLGFPKVLPGTSRYQALRESEVPENGGGDVAERENFGKSYKDFPIALWMLLKNPTYMLGSLASCSEALVIAGFTTFLPKIIETQFQQTAGTAAVVAGVIGVPGGVLGHVFAAILVNRFKMKTPNLLRFNVLYCLIVCAATPVLFLACTNKPVAGITHPYFDSNEAIKGLNSSCNSNCSCASEYFIPVCGADNINYFTACHAGCDYSMDINGTTFFFDCSCINATYTSPEGWMAKVGECESSCKSLGEFLGIFFFVVLFNFMSGTPALVVTFRVVPPNMRSFALGLQWLLIRTLGGIPGPILFGAIIDLTCILWQTRECSGTRGSCWINDSDEMTFNVFILSISCKLVSAILFFLAYWFYKPPAMQKEEIEITQQTSFVNEAFTEDGDTVDDSVIKSLPLDDASQSSTIQSNEEETSSEQAITVL